MSETITSKRCRKCGEPIRLRSVGNDMRGKTVRRWCRSDDAGSPAGGPRPPIDCPRGGYHLPVLRVTGISP